MQTLKRKIVIWCIAIAVTALAAAICLTVALPGQTANAETDYRLIIYRRTIDSAYECEEGIDYTRNGNEYYFEYTPGIDLYVAGLTYKGNPVTDVEWTKTPQMKQVLYETVEDGDDIQYEVSYYSIECKAGDSRPNFKVFIEPCEVSVVSWIVDSCQYGQDVEPEVQLSADIPDEVSFYTLESGVYDKPFRAIEQQWWGEYSIMPKLPQNSNYRLSTGTEAHVFSIGKFQGTIEVERETYAGQYEGKTLDARKVLGAKVMLDDEEITGYKIACKYKEGEEGTFVNSHDLPNVGTYYVYFEFDDPYANYNFVNPKRPAEVDTYYQIVIQQAEVTLQGSDDVISLEYGKNRSDEETKAAIYNLAMAQDALRVLDNNENEIVTNVNDFEFSYRLEEDGEYQSNPPTTIGDGYAVRVRYKGSYNYRASEGYVDLKLAVVKCQVNFTLTTGMRSLAYGQTFGETGDYTFDLSKCFEIRNEEYRAWIEEGNEASYTYAYEYYNPLMSQWETYEPSGITPPLPGDYRASVRIAEDNPLYRGSTGSKYVEITVRKVQLTKDDVVVAKRVFEYGEAIELSLSLADGKTPMGGEWRVAYLQSGVEVEAKNAGAYEYTVTLVNDRMYGCEEPLLYDGDDGIVIRKKAVTLTIWNLSVVYGEKLSFVKIERGNKKSGQLVWWDSGAVLQSDEEEFKNNLSAEVQSAKDADKWVKQTDATYVCNADGYPWRMTSNSPNYDVTIRSEAGADTAVVSITPRVLGVKVSLAAGGMTMYEGAQPQIKIELSNYLNDADQNAIIKSLNLVYKDAQGNVLTDVPTAAGVYTVELKQSASVVLLNYDVQYSATKLTIKSKSLATSETTFAVSGQFDTTGILNVMKVSNSRYSAVANEMLKGYNVVAAYEIDDPLETETGQIVFRLQAPSGAKNVKVLFMDGDKWATVDYKQEGEYLVFTQPFMSTRYLICAPKETNWLLIGLIAGGVVLVTVGVVLGVTIPKAKRNKKLAEAASKMVSAPTAGAPKVLDEDEELDSLIANFDESTVEHEMTPAERIALREKEEKYRQYKARLDRMRTSDRTLTDTLQSLGLEKSADDDDIIARMIEADEERARQVEEELRREQEEKAREEEQKKAVILERSDEVLEQKTFAPTKADLDDDDIDI